MKYNISVNQEAFLRLCSEKIDIIDMVILDFVTNFCREENPKIQEKRLIIKETGKEEIYTWVDRNLVNEELPSLRFKQEESISQRLKKLEKEGFIKTKVMPSSEGKRLYVRITPKALLIQFNRANQSTLDDPTNLHLLANQSTLDNHIHNINHNHKDIATPSQEQIFSFKNYISSLFISKSRINQIIGLYWQCKNIQFTNKNQANAGLKRDLRAAKNLEGYENKRILEIMEWLNQNANYKWTLETVHKHIDEDLNKLPHKAGVTDLSKV